MNVYCKKHPEELLRSMYYILRVVERKIVGTTTRRTEWVYCVKCDKPYKPKASFTSA